MEMQPVHYHLPTSSIFTLWPIVLWVDLQMQPDRCSQCIIVCPHLQFTKSYQLYYGLTPKEAASSCLGGLRNNKQIWTWLTYGLIDRGAPRLKQRLDVHTLVCVLHKPYDFCQDPHHTHYPQVELLLVHACIALHQEKMPPPLDAHGIWLHNVNDKDLQ